MVHSFRKFYVKQPTGLSVENIMEWIICMRLKREPWDTKMYENHIEMNEKVLICPVQNNFPLSGKGWMTYTTRMES